MKLPPSNECNVSLEIYACKILFACAILELHSEENAIMEDELECAHNILHHIHGLYEIARSSRERNFYKRDIIPVFTPYARHMYASFEHDKSSTIEEEDHGEALSGENVE